MKKLFLMLAVAAFSAQTVSAQALHPSKTTDNWYIGVNGGVAAKATGVKVLKNINPTAGLRIGRWITPVVGLAAEGDVYFNNKGSKQEISTFVKGINVSLLGTTNFSNWLGGYPGEPRAFEVIGIYGLGWGHAFGTKAERNAQFDKNVLTSKLGIDFTLNLGAAKAVQLFLEPNIVYGLNARRHGVQFNLNDAAIGVNLGLNYKFGNSNGTHNFTTAQLRDQAEIDGLNGQINDLRAQLSGKDAKIAADAQTIADLQAQLAAAKNVPAPVVVEQKPNTLQPTVIFRQGKSVIDPAQYASVEMVAKYLKNHPESKVLIQGYASPEGSAELNQRLSEARATAVKNALVKKYKIAAERLTTEGKGATDELFDEVDFNRVVTFTDTTK